MGLADSLITKRALAAALRELMEEAPFEKINVARICARCGMSRKSFYYHFKDKYDLVNWIFDTEFIKLGNALTNASSPDDRWELIEEICQFFYQNRGFYRKALMIKGQNSFSEHLRDACVPLIKLRFQQLVGNEGADDFSVNFYADAALCAIERWLLSRECLPPDEFAAKLKSMLLTGVRAIYREMNGQ